MATPADIDKDEIIELSIECAECEMGYSVFVNPEGFLEQARYCPFCGEYNVEYDRGEVD